MKRICAWCGIDLGLGQTGGPELEHATHGICGKCLRSLVDEAGEFLCAAASRWSSKWRDTQAVRGHGLAKGE